MRVGPIHAGLAALLPAVLLLGACGASEAPERPNVVLVTLDTTRADYLSSYGGELAETPAFDALAAKGALFEHAIAPASWTLPSVGSFLTSSPPWMHGATDFIGVGLSRDVTTLPEELSSHGYECLASVGNPFVNADMGFDRGFHVYDVYSQPVETKLAASRLFDRAWLAERGLDAASRDGRNG